MKKVLLFLCMSLLFSFSVSDDLYAYSDIPYFPDVPDTHWAFSYVQRLYEGGITTGFGDGTYRPENNTTRAEMAAFLLRTADFARGVKITLVDTSGNNYADPAEAMSDLDAWCGTPSSTNPCLVKILPGVYDIGSTSLQMQDYVDIAGSGENVTKITGSLSGLSTGIIEGADNAELRFLTVENLGSGADKNGIYNNNVSPKITNVTAIASGGPSGPNNGIYNNASSPVMTNVTALAVTGGGSNYGIYNNASSPVMMNVTVSSTGGGSNYGVYTTDPLSTVDINHSVISGDDFSIFTDTSSTTLVGSTKLVGPSGGTGTNTCALVYDDTFTFYLGTCP
jgi:hypothetical protein